MLKNVFLLLQKHWGILTLSAILLTIIALNIKPGFLILGNDNFSPELDPGLTFERQLSSPAWRTYRVLGLPSDSEQADIFRSGLYVVLEKFLAVWVVSQGFLFFSLFIASISMGQVTRYFVGKEPQIAILLGGLLYLCSMLTSWIYFFPVALFVAAYAFLPFTLWRLLAFLEKQSVKNVCLLLVASLLLSTSALTATMFLVGGAVLLILGAAFGFGKNLPAGRQGRTLAAAFFIIFGIQAFWMLPFIPYVQNNTPALKEGAIYRDITATTIENEARHNTAFNTIRYFSSWMDTKEDTKTFTFPYRDWYKNSFIATILSIVPVLLGVMGAIWVIRGKDKRLLAIPILAFAGWYFIKGINPPFGFVYAFLQDNFPTIAQVFRWQSSKMWPFLALSMPILGVIGVMGVIGKMYGIKEKASLIVKRPEHHSQTLGASRFALGLVVATSVALLVYVYPYFTGNLVRESMYVQVPKEYQELAQYLKKTDSTSRIYLSPEANTLYFRNYSFGFWGSVLLNYILPNPIIEKALIAGSFENEQAFDQLTNSYFSESPGTFAKALMRYNTPYVLSDKYASAGTVGYPYDWELHKKVVEDNPFFEKVWQKGNLTLYKIHNFQEDDQKSAIPLYTGSDFARLNTILSALGNQDTYFTSDKTVGTLYPFALPFSNYTYVSGGIKATHTYTGPKASFRSFLTSEDIIASPSQLEYSLEKEEIVITPLLPTLSVNNTNYLFQLPQKRYVIDNQLAFIAVDEQVLDVRQFKAALTTGIPFGQVGKASITSFTRVFEPLDIAHGASGLVCKKIDKLTKCETSSIAIPKDTIIEVDFRVSVKIPENNLGDEKAVQMLVCFESFNKKTCLNRNNSMFITSTGEAKLLIPWKFGTGDSLKVYVDFKEQTANTAVTIDRFVVKQYTQSAVASFKEESKAETLQVFQIPLNTKDSVSLTIPILEGPNSAPMKSDGRLIPEASTTAFEEGKPYESKIEVGKEGLTISNKESNSSIYPKLSYLDPRGGIAMLFADAENVSGIPLDLSIRNIQKPHRLWQTKLPYKKDAQNLHLFMLPQELQSYYFEAFSTGLGPRASTTVIKALYFQIVPKSWYGMKLEPQSTPIGLKGLVQQGVKDTNRYSGEIREVKGDTGNGRIVTIPTAISPFWKLSVDGVEEKNRVVVNGWQQAWMVSENGKAEVVFTPSSLVYIGFAPLILIVGWILFKSLASIRK